MRKRLKKYFVPHEENEYNPHLLREAAVLVISVVALAGFAFSVFHVSLLTRDSDFLAAVLPAVLVDLANGDRASNDLPELVINPVLEEAARRKAEDMAKNSYFSHSSPDGTEFWQWFIDAGYTFTYAGENLAVNFSDSVDVENAWMNSEGHKENILNGNFTEVGIATAEGEFQGRETIFVVQLFGRPALASASVLGEVAGEPDVIVEEDTQVIEESDTFIAVVTTKVPPNGVAEDHEEEESKELPVIVEEPAIDIEDREELAGEEVVGLVPQVSFLDRLKSQPRQLLKYFYILLGGIVLLALIFAIFIEIEKQHPKNVLYGILLLILIILLLYLNRAFLFSELLIL